jgi:hypothetical protein
MPRYSHAYDFAFEVTSETEDGSDVTPSMLRAALIDRAARLPDTEIPEACGRYDTHEIKGNEPESGICEKLPVNRFTVSVNGCTSEQAEQVLRERLGHDEDYGFDYQINF